MPEFSRKAELFGTVIKSTPKALLIDFGDQKVWIPQSQIDDDSEVWKEGDSGMVVLSEWIAQQKGLI